MHRRKLDREAKAKNMMNSTVSSKSTEAKQLAQQGIEQNLPPKQTRRPLPWLQFKSFFYARKIPAAYSVVLNA